MYNIYMPPFSLKEVLRIGVPSNNFPTQISITSESVQVARHNSLGFGWLALMVILTLVATSCRPSDQSTVSTNGVTPESLASTLESPTTDLTPLPITVVPAQLSPLSTPSGEDAVVIGRVFRLDGKTAIPNTTVFLATVYWNTDHTSGVFALDVNAAPKSATSDNGAFMFSGVKAGEYTFVVGDPERKTAILSTPSGQAQVFKVDPGQILNLGDVKLDY